MDNLIDLYTAVMNDPTPPYDQRLNIAMSEAQYNDYQNNQGHTYWLFLRKLVHRLQPQKILELGTSIGRSALFMLVALPENSKLVTIDIGSYQRTELSGFAFDERLEIVFGDSLDISIIRKIGTNFDFLFIDSEHSYDQISVEWKLYRHLLTNGAIVALDDINLNLGMRKFWDDLSFEKVDTGSSLHFSGFGLFKYKS